jgi:hypothetical protein
MFHDSPLLAYPAVALFFFGFAAMLIALNTFGRKQSECDQLAILPLSDDKDGDL